MSEAFIAETARAWQVRPKEVANIADWVDRKVNPDYQALIFAKLLRKHMGKYKERKS